jgi:spermidine synthase
VEYFESCRRLLRENGVICQYLPLHKMSARHFRVALATFHEVFPRTTVWLGFSHGIMVGRAGDETPGISVDFVARLMSIPEISRDLYACHLETPYDLFSTFILGEPEVKALVAGETLRNTDDHPILEYSGPEALRRDAWQVNMRQLMQAMASPLPRLTGFGPPGPPREVFSRSLDRYLEGKRGLYRGLIAWQQGDLKAAFDHFVLGLRVNPEDLELADMADLARTSLEKNRPLPFATH